MQREFGRPPHPRQHHAFLGRFKGSRCAPVLRSALESPCEMRADWLRVRGRRMPPAGVPGSGLHTAARTQGNLTVWGQSRPIGHGMDVRTPKAHFPGSSGRNISTLGWLRGRPRPLDFRRQPRPPTQQRTRNAALSEDPRSETLPPDRQESLICPKNRANERSYSKITSRGYSSQGVSET